VTRKKTDELPSIDPALRKVDRARKHIDDLEQGVAAYVEDSTTWRYDDDSEERGRVIVKVEQMVAPPVELALICGDVVHNLRTALDYVIFQLGIADKGMVSDESQFPLLLTTPSARDWKSIVNGILGLLSPVHVEEVRRLQPFSDARDNTINVKLGMLSALDNRDKHRLPLVVDTAASRGTVSLDKPVRRVQITHQVGDVIPIKDDTELFRLKAWGGPINVAIHARIQFGISFGHERGPTVLNLRDLANTAAGVIGAFGIDIGAAARKSPEGSR